MVMVNLNDDLYEQVSKLVKKRPIEFPSLKNFVDKAVDKKLEIVRERDVKEKKLKQEEYRKVKRVFSLIFQKKDDELKEFIEKEIWGKK